MKLTHPNLPGQPIDVLESAVPHHERAGWRRQQPDPPPEPDEQPSDEAPERGLSHARPRRRRGEDDDTPAE